MGIIEQCVDRGEQSAMLSPRASQGGHWISCGLKKITLSYFIYNMKFMTLCSRVDFKGCLEHATP